MEVTLILQGLDCAHCAEEIRSRVEKMKDVDSAEMNFMAKKLRIRADAFVSGEELLSKVTKIVSDLEPDIEVVEEASGQKPSGAEDEEKHGSMRGQVIKVAVALAVYLTAIFAPLSGGVEWVLLLASYLTVGGEVLLRAGKNILRGRVFDENFLMSIATVGAIAIGDFREAGAVMLFYQVGELFQDYAVNRSRKSIAGLMDIRPDYANLVEGGELRRVAPETVNVGDVIIVRPGEKLPLDGRVLKGTSSLDTVALTGESAPRTAEPGSDVISGSVNLNGLLEIEVTKPFGESTVAKILDLVENAGSKKAEAENFITKFARYYTPAVVIAAALLAVIPPLFFNGDWKTWIYQALTFLVVSCPCALVISIPLGFFGGIGGASRNGILVKGGNYLEALAKTKTLVFDKTGTLTQGVLEVTGAYPQGIAKEALLEYAAYAEHFSSHPIAQSIQKAYGGPVPGEGITVEEIAGKGVKAVHGADTILAGNLRLMEAFGIQAAQVQDATVVHVAVNDTYAGYLEISDVVKPDAKAAMAALKREGVHRTVMLTGDSQIVAARVADDLGLDEYHAQLLPQDKVEKVEELLRTIPAGEKLAFVGDGINDAPVLARADIGIAMGGLGSDAAIEAADIVLMNDEPSKIATAIRIAKKTLRIVKENIVFAMGVKVLVLVLAAFGYASMWAAVFADVGVAVLAILNAVRCLNVKKS